LATPLSETDLRNYILLLERHGIAFNYLLNGAYFGNREWMRPWQKRVTVLLFDSYLTTLASSVTLTSHPQLSRKPNVGTSCNDPKRASGSIAAPSSPSRPSCDMTAALPPGISRCRTLSASSH
jgi:guanyl-specific ribonuclease Sa